MVQQFLSRLPRIRSSWFLFIQSGKSSLPFNLSTTYPQKDVTTKKIMLTLISHLSQSELYNFWLPRSVIISRKLSTIKACFKIPHSSSTNISLGKSTKFLIPSISIPSSYSSTVTTLSEGLSSSCMKTWFSLKIKLDRFIICERSFLYVTFGSRTIAPQESCPPTLILTLTLNQTLTLTGGNFPRGQLSGHRYFHIIILICFFQPCRKTYKQCQWLVN